MLQSQIVRAIGNLIDKEDLVFPKYAALRFHFTVWLLIYVIVTIYKTVPLQRSGIVTVKLRSRT